MIFFIFYHVKSLFLHLSFLKKPTPSQINLIKDAKKSFFIYEKIQKYHKRPALHARHCIWQQALNFSMASMLI